MQLLLLSGSSLAVSGFYSKYMPYIELLSPNRCALSFHIWVLSLELVLSCCFALKLLPSSTETQSVAYLSEEALVKLN